MRTVAAFSKVEEAHLLRASLEGNGIAAFVRDEFTVAANPLYANAIGGVKVEVADEDFDRAREILALDAPPAAPGPPAADAVPPHAFGRYLLLGVVLFAVLFAALTLAGTATGGANPARYEMPLVVSLAVAALVAGLAALLDL
jgi:Putative prokaryotic signal transducing protein